MTKKRQPNSSIISVLEEENLDLHEIDVIPRWMLKLMVLIT